MKPIGKERITKLGFTIDRNLRFDYHGITLCKKVGRKVSALGRLVKVLTIEQRKTLMKVFTESQFAYCPLIWMFCIKRVSCRINHAHERAFRMGYKNYGLPFNNLLRKSNSYSIHHVNIQSLLIELYKVENLC